MFPMHFLRTTTAARLNGGKTVRVVLACAAMTAIVLPVVGCGSHGNYTAEHLSGAKEKMGALKAGTEFQMSHQAFLAGDLQKALRHIEYSIELSERVPRSHILRGRIMMEAGNLEQANISFRRAEELDEKNVDAQYFRGVLAERLMRPEEALAHYRAAAKLDAVNSQYVVAAAEMLIQLDRRDEAEEFLNSNRGNFDHSPGIRQSLGHLAMLKGEYEVAEKLFFEATLLAPNDQPITEDLVQALMARGKFAGAETHLARLLSKAENKDRRDLKHQRAMCLLEIGKPADSRQVYMSLTGDEAGNSDYEAWLGLARVSLKLKDGMRLREAAGRLIAMDGERSEGFVMRAMAMRMGGELSKASANLEKALSIDENPETLTLLGLVESERGNDAIANRAFARALELDPNNAQAASMMSGGPVLAGESPE
jgi:Flp pilus assembly protein TadD